MTTNAEGADPGQRLRHAANGEAFRPFDIHLQEINSVQAKQAAEFVDGDGGNTEPVGAVGTVAQVVGGILNGGAPARGFGDGAMDGDNVPQTIVLDEFFQAVKGARMSFDGDHAARSTDRAGKSKRVFPNAAADIEDHVAGFGLIAAKEYSLCEGIQTRQVEPDIRVWIGEVPVRSLVNPNVLIAEDSGDPMALPASEGGCATRQQRPQERTIEEILHASRERDRNLQLGLAHSS